MKAAAVKLALLSLVLLLLLSSCAPIKPLDDSDFSATNGKHTYYLEEKFKTNEKAQYYDIGCNILLNDLEDIIYVIEIEGLCIYNSNMYQNSEYRKSPDFLITYFCFIGNTYSTKRGIRIGSSIQDVFRAYGRTDKTKVDANTALKYSYNNKIILFMLDKREKVQYIEIYFNDLFVCDLA